METKGVHGGASQTATIVEQYTSLLREISRRHAKE
jgi:hypothetical protein